MHLLILTFETLYWWNIIYRHLLRHPQLLQEAVEITFNRLLIMQSNFYPVLIGNL